MLFPYRTPTSSKSHTRKQKFLNHTAHDLKMTSNDLKKTSKDVNEIDEPVSKKLRTKNNIKEGDSSDCQNNGRDLLKKAFSSS